MSEDQETDFRSAQDIDKDRPLMRRLVVSACLVTAILGWPSRLIETAARPAWGSQAHLLTTPSHLVRGAHAGSAGQTTRWQLVSRGNRELDGIACPSLRVCYAFGGTGHSAVTWRTTIVATKDAGKTWRTTVIQPAGIPLFHIACPSVQTCYAVGIIETEGTSPPPGVSNDVLATRDGGHTWQTVLTSNMAQIRSGACGAGRLDCVYVGNISCPTMSICFAPGFGPSPKHGTRPTSVLLTTTNGGRSWHLRVIHVLSDTAAMACPVVTTCYMVGRVNAVTTDRGVTWRTQPDGPGKYVSMITCPAVQVCYTVGFRSATKTMTDAGTIAVTRNGGKKWYAFYYPDASPHGISCPTARICYAAGETMGGSSAVILVTGDGGNSWQREYPSFGALTGARAIACPGPTTCYVVSGRGGIYKRS